MIKIVIADDDEPILNMLKNYLSSFEDISVVGTAFDGESLVKEVREKSPDAVYVDIQMPGIDGLSAVYQLQQENTSLFVVFVTAYTQYAVEAFNLDATDYLTKPVTITRLEKSLNKIKWFKEHEISTHKYKAADNKDKILLKQGHGIIIIDKESIIFIEKQGKKSIIHTSRGVYETSFSLASIEEMLHLPDFFRCHKGYIINIRQVEKIVPYADRSYEVKFFNYPHKVPMRREKFEEFCTLM